MQPLSIYPSIHLPILLILHATCVIKTVYRNTVGLRALRCLTSYNLLDPQCPQELNNEKPLFIYVFIYLFTGDGVDY